MTSTLKRLCAIFVLLATLAVACSKPQTEYAHMLQLSTHGVGFSAEGGSSEIMVAPHPEDMVWTVDATKAAKWVACEIVDDAIRVTVEPNVTTAPRHTSFNIVSHESLFEAIEIVVSQESAVEAELIVDAPEEYLFDSAVSSYTFGVRSNSEWEISSDAEWLTTLAEPHAQRATITVEANDGQQQRSAEVVIAAGDMSQTIVVTQDTHANNPYYKLVGSWEITAAKWFYSTNGSLNSLDYAPSPADYYLIFDIDEGDYGKTLVMRDFLYPGTELEVRYDETTGGIVIPFGWTVLSYDVFFYVTLVSTTQFSYASLEVEATPNDEVSTLTLDMPTVDGFSYVGFGLWTYDENGAKIAVGSNYRPTVFPTNDVKFVKKE